MTAPTPQNTPLQAAPITLGLSRPTVPDIAEDGEDDGGELGTAALQGLVQGRLRTLLGRSSGYVEGLPAPVRRAVSGLKGVQAQYNDLQAQYKRECWELEKKVRDPAVVRGDRADRAATQYAELQKPLYARRTAIVAGESAPTTEEFERGEAVAKEDDDEYEPLPPAAADEAAVKGVPEFWLTALRNHVELAEIITDKDAEVLKHLTDIRLSYLPSEPAPGYKLTFVFSPNEWFENMELEKTYVYQTEVGYGGDFIYERAEGTEIRWKAEDKDLTKVVEVKKQRNKSPSIFLCLPMCIYSFFFLRRHKPHASRKEDAAGRLVLQLLQPADAAKAGGRGGHGRGGARGPRAQARGRLPDRRGLQGEARPARRRLLHRQGARVRDRRRGRLRGL
jgi:nucleosome assembly protein 1-like 1